MLLLLWFTTLVYPAMPHRSEPNAQIEDQVDQIISTLTPHERVAQLMLVTFEGASLNSEAGITQLIRDYNIGGVVLLAANDNILGQVNTPRLVQSLTTDLQSLAYEGARLTSAEEGKTGHAFIPLFIAASHDGNGQPGTEIATGTTPLPSYMALGATWKTEDAHQVGEIAGSELNTMGINMLLGPALDVVQRAPTEREFSLGVNSFGGEPFWVGQMGQAYTMGVHEGSEGRVAVIARSFPGLGLADTEPDQEIPVVPRTLDELSQFDLIPFAAVTRDFHDPLERVDGLQCANIRYQGQNARSITRPICVDEQAFDALLSLDNFRLWRDEGVVVSSALGTQAIRRYYNTTPFPHRQVAREAFLAGNDLLYLAQFGVQTNESAFENIVDTIDFFAESYESDPVFRARVDQALRRILTLKLSLYYGNISLENVLTAPRSIDTVGTASAPLYKIAQDGVTLIAPRRENLTVTPSREDTIVIFSDVQLVQQCSFCAAYPLVSVNALEGAIERFYGPYAGAQIRPENVISFTFNQLLSYLYDEAENMASETNEFRTHQRIGEALRDARWIVFVTLDGNSAQNDMVRDFLETQPDLVEHTHVVVMSLGAPLYLSSTEISKLTAYYGLYSSTPPYIDAAARALFNESTFSGALPISLPAVGYNVTERTSPDPSQTIQMNVETLNGETVALSTPDTITMRPGERLVLRTSAIVDLNGNRVPDDTLVEFTLHFLNDNLLNRQISLTRSGSARTVFTPTEPGRVYITAASENATRSNTFQINVTTALNPASTETRIPNVTPQPTPTENGIAIAGADGPSTSPTTASSNTMTNTSTTSVESARKLELFDLFLALFGLALIGVLAFSAGMSTTLTFDGGLRVVLGSFVAGLTGYIYYALHGPGAHEITLRLDDLAPMVVTVGTSLVGLIFTWWSIRNAR
ncbi:MAG TPA: glycoside hydrolase family 3 N-terminal domain-containing protein [Aggregatilineaceae bacterium]|nr:glycoside hydrolase family 3 N-terminal domain-containing protein [Aggregatilineaceae bacterium]